MLKNLDIVTDGVISLVYVLQLVLFTLRTGFKKKNHPVTEYLVTGGVSASLANRSIVLLGKLIWSLSQNLCVGQRLSPVNGAFTYCLCGNAKRE